MKQILFISLLILGLWACNDDGDRITVTDLPENAFTFKPVTGGAVMHYVLPSGYRGCESALPEYFRGGNTSGGK